MDILVVRPDGSWYSRPDVTLVRDRDRFFLPDDCTGALACRCRALRVDKAGKAIAEKYFHRYFSEWAPGVLFYGVLDGAVSRNGQPTPGSPVPGCTPYLDRSTWIDFGFRPLSELVEADIEGFARSVAAISTHLPLRIGDLICIETHEPVPLRRGETFENLLVS